MARTNNLTNFLTDVAAAIKNKKGVNTNIPAANFDIEINAFDILHGQEKTVSPMTTNQSITPDAGYNGMTVVNITAVDSTIDANISPENIKSGVNILNVTGTVEELVGETINIIPTTNQQVITPSTGKNGITQATVEAVTAAIDPNIAQNNIKAGVTILGVTGNVEPDKPDQTKSVDPTTSQQVIEPDTGYELASVTVNAVTSAIDINIQEGNIREGVNILGIVGTFEGSGGGIDLNVTNLTREQVQEKALALDVFQHMTLDSSITNAHALFAETNYTIVPNVDFVNVTDVSNLCMDCQSLINIPNFNTPNATNFSYMFYNCANLIGAFSPGLNYLDISGFNMKIAGDTSAMFMNCSNITNIPDFDYTLVENTANMFSGDVRLVNVNMWNPQNITNSYGMFYNCENLHIANIYELESAINTSDMFKGCTIMTTCNIINITTVQDMSNMFYNCYNLVNLNCSTWNLSNVSNMESAFVNCNLNPQVYRDLANVLPMAENLTNQYLANMGLNLDKFEYSSWVILENKGYIDASAYRGNYVVEYW